ncbi:hypothetical protein BgiMline_015307, partial [Biomphalaria glabrata]
GTVFSQKCMEDFEKKFFPYICINGHSKEVYKVPCDTEDFYIEDFVLHTSRVSKDECLGLSGFNYNQTITASCLNKENKDLSKRIASTLMSYRKNILEAQSLLNKIVQGVHLLCAFYGCIPDTEGFEVDICSFSSLVGCKSFYILFKSKVISSEIRPSSCSCSIKSPSKSIAVKPLDVRLKATDTLRSYQGKDDIGYDIFEKNYFLWSMDGPTVFHTDYLNITLTTREKWQPWNNLLIRIQ